MIASLHVPQAQTQAQPQAQPQTQTQARLELRPKLELSAGLQLNSPSTHGEGSVRGIFNLGHCVRHPSIEEQ